MDEEETWVSLEQDDYGKVISVDTLSYAFRTTGKYRVVVTDEFRTGIETITAEIGYKQKTPEAVSAEVKVFKDGKEIEYKLGDELTEVGEYTVSVTDECGNQSVYEFEIEKRVNGWWIALAVVGVLVFAGAVVFVLKIYILSYKGIMCLNGGNGLLPL
ncbi:MAG: hypothetical protein IJ329_04810 [Clostridia bacterium]|nr:hypothetical protein [Clostridia bacterium]